MRMDWQCKIGGESDRNEAIEEIYVRKKTKEETRAKYWSLLFSP